MVSLATGAGKRGLPYPECLASTWAAGPGCPATQLRQPGCAARDPTHPFSPRRRRGAPGDRRIHGIAVGYRRVGAARGGRLARQVETTIARPFDLERGPLLRVSLLRLAEDDHVLVMVQHHIVSDGWSMQLMVEELVQLYAGYSQGLDVVLPALPIQYADYAPGSAAGWRRGKGAPVGVLDRPAGRRAAGAGVAVRSAAAGPAEPSWRAVGFRAIAELVEAVRPWPSVKAPVVSCCCWPRSRRCCIATAGRRISVSVCRSPIATAWRPSG